MLITWTFRSRYGDEREFAYQERNGELTISCQNTQYVSFSGESGKLVAVDPDGGPFLAIGGNLRTTTGAPMDLFIDKIVSHALDRRTGIFHVVATATAVSPSSS